MSRRYLLVWAWKSEANLGVRGGRVLQAVVVEQLGGAEEGFVDFADAGDGVVLVVLAQEAGLVERDGAEEERLREGLAEARLGGRRSTALPVRIPAAASTPGSAASSA